MIALLLTLMQVSAAAAGASDPQTPAEIIALQKHLKTMVEEDQAIRLATPISVSHMQEVDARNRAGLERIFAQYGWPKQSVVGKKAASDFWLLVQHQDENREFQQKVLAAMERAVQEGEASQSDYAYLYDRVRVGEGKPQHWGTQTSCVNGKPVMMPVDDPAGLEQRRRALGLPGISKYLKLVKPFCKVAP